MFIKIKNGCLLRSCNSGKAKATPGFWRNSSAHWPSIPWAPAKLFLAKMSDTNCDFPVVAEGAINPLN